MRGLKYRYNNKRIPVSSVALLVSAWIEIDAVVDPFSVIEVALLVSAWIEIGIVYPASQDSLVALLVSAWIEIAVVLYQHLFS